jgi:hypothetical protein
VKNKSGKGTNTRVDYDKNKPYTSNPLFHKLGEYFTMPLGGKYVMRGGAIDTWWYRVLKRIPEHYEEHFYEVARVRLANGEYFNTKSRRPIPGCPFDRELVTFVLTEHFCYNTPYLQIVTMLKDRALEISDSTLGNIVHKIIAYFRGEMAESWEKEIQKADYWMMDETPGMVGCIKGGTKSYLNRYFWGIKAKAMKLVWFLYENGSRGLKAIKPYLDQFIGFFTTDGYVVYKVYEKEDHPLQTRSACLTHIRRYFVDALEEHRERALIETVNGELKNIAQIEHSRHRSFNNFIANALSAIAAYCFFEKKPAIEVNFINDRQLTIF